MSLHRYVRCLLLFCALFIWTALSLALPQGEKAEKKGDVPAGQVNIEEKVNKKIQLVHMVKPVYPAEAKKARIQGLVKIDALISKDGEVVEATALGGPEVLRPAALAAVRQWRYKPLGVEVKTTIHVNYQLPRKAKAAEPKP